MVRGASAAALVPRTALRDIGDRVVGDGDDRVSRPVGRLRGWSPLGGLGRPAPQVIEDAPHHGRIVDQRDHAHWVFALGTYERVGLVDLADEPRPGGLGAGGELAHRCLGCRGRLRGLKRLYISAIGEVARSLIAKADTCACHTSRFVVTSSITLTTSRSLEERWLERRIPLSSSADLR